MKKRIAIIFGGHSSEYSVSLQSASAVIKTLDTSKYEPLLIGITKYGNWYKINPVIKLYDLCASFLKLY